MAMEDPLLARRFAPLDAKNRDFPAMFGPSCHWCTIQDPGRKETAQILMLSPPLMGLGLPMVERT
jgi:hypothetical protein